MLDTKKLKYQIKKYLIISIITLIISLIYELFSHGVYSKSMLLSFLIPLLMGSFMYYIIYSHKKRFVYDLPSKIYNSSIITFLLYLFINGILEIYGTTNNILDIYLYLGFILLIISILLNIKFYKNKKVKKK